MSFLANRVSATASVFLALTLSGCGSGDSTSAQPLTPDSFHGLTVPPDPGSQANATVVGVDTDNNGVRDEVDRQIAATYGTSTDRYDGVVRVAKALQRYLSVNGSASTSTETTQAAVVSGACIRRRFGGDGIAASHAIDDIFALTVNTPERLAAYKATSTASTETSTIIPSQPCQ